MPFPYTFPFSFVPRALEAVERHYPQGLLRGVGRGVA